MRISRHIYIHALAVFSLFIISSNVYGQPVKDSLRSLPLNHVKIQGYLGGRIDQCIGNRIMKQDYLHLIEPFRYRNEDRLWQSEFWGKWILSAIAAYEYQKDPRLFGIIQQAVSGLIATQTPDGYIGNYTPEARLTQWDIWGTKYTLLGLLSWYDISGDKKALRAATRLADNLLSLVGRGKTNIVKTGNYRGMPSSSVLEPMLFLYRHTGEERYLNFAKYIVEQWETSDGPGLISKALKGIAVADRFPFPSSWWSYENGQKAYEMMSCYEGLLELYRITGHPEYLKAVQLAVQNIIDTEINLAGSGTAFECFYHGGEQQTEPAYHTMETCVTFTWIKLCNNLLLLTENPMYADQIEKSVYNALLASMKDDASQIAKYSPLEGIRHEGEKQCGMNINCCNANGPRAFTLIPGIAYQSSGEGIFVNLFCESSATIALNEKENILIEQKTDYPATDRIEITLHPGKPATFTLALRIPAWSAVTLVSVNDVKAENIQPGTYHKITRTWKDGDQVIIQPDLRGRLTNLNGYQAITRGPVLLARDSRFGDGFVDETAVVIRNDHVVELQPVAEKPANIWMSFTVPMILGTDLEGEFREPRPVHFCDFSSAGNTWSADSRYRVWIKETLNVQKAPYKPY
ncbi:MAG: glycoside hydrolase family 127 protein [Bacteroidales bacterium]|nr:glycoside hydrolase family 127 protein [Bacteroidales bacterium]